MTERKSTKINTIVCDMVSPEGSVFVVRMDDLSILSLDGQF
jgi:hypothetical protein